MRALITDVRTWFRTARIYCVGGFTEEGLHYHVASWGHARIAALLEECLIILEDKKP